MRGSGFYPNHFRLLFVVLVIFSLCIPERVFAQSRYSFPMPDVVGLTIPQAQKKVLTAGRKARASSARAVVYARQSNARPAGQIIRQLELPGTPMSYGMDDLEVYGEVTFQVVVSTGPAQAKNPDKRTVDKAERDPRPGNFALGVETQKGITELFKGIAEAIVQSGDSFPMPNVIGLTVPEAERRVYSAGRSIKASGAKAQIVERRTDARPAGQIIRQLERPGTPMRGYSDDVGGNYGEVSFRVVVSTGPARPTTFPMPNVTGLSVPEAEKTVYSAGQVIRVSSVKAQIVERRTDARPAGQIIQQLERPGTPMRGDSDDVSGNYGEVAFRVVVSTGPARPTTFPMPNVTGLSVPEAEKIVYSAGQVIRVSSAKAQIVERRNDARPAGQIIRQLERPGTPMRGYSDDVGGNYGEVAFRVVVSTGPEPAPDFVGGTVDAARQYAERNKITVNVGTGQESPRIPEGIVIRQDPTAGQPMPRRRVTVYPSTGYSLPNYVEQNVELARRDSRRLGFDLEERREDSVEVPRGVIFEQSPAAETLLPLDRPVNIVVSDGWPTPNFLRLEENDATALAAERQVNLRVAERRQDREVPPGIVIDQNPPPGALLAPTQAVEVVVSATDPTPRLIGLTEDEASTLAARRDFNLVITRETSMDFAFGLITRQSPEPGDPLPVDGRVSVIISIGPLTPDFVGRTEEEAIRIAADMDITLVRTSPAEHFELSAGRVIEQQPVAGVVMSSDRGVNISLSLGWPVAPNAMGQLAGSVKREFLARHPNAIFEQGEKLLTIEPAGTVISQDPQPKVKLGPKQRLHLVSSATKPPWLWPVGGVVLIALALGGFALLKSVLKPSTQTSMQTENPGGVRLRLTKDHGVQTTDIKDDGDRDRPSAGDIVKIRVKVDLGEQSAGPNNRGDDT